MIKSWKKIIGPWNKEGLRQAVVDVDNEVVIGYRIDFRPRKLTINKNSLQQKFEVHTTISHIKT